MKIHQLEPMITEMPLLYPEALNLRYLTNISLRRLAESYTKIDSNDKVDVYQHNQNHGFVAGRIVGDDLKTLLMITVKTKPLPMIPTGLSKCLQVTMVHTSLGEEQRGIATFVYTTIASRIALVSDHEQYLGAQGLWKGLARRNDIPVYVFDCGRRDYFRDYKKVLIKYNGQNIRDNDIWGKAEDYRKVLLVATKEPIH